MAILAECPICHSKLSNKIKKCKRCGTDMDRAKRSKKRVRYWISYRMADGKQRRKSLNQLGLNPYSIEDARDADVKRRVDVRENGQLFNEYPEAKMTYSELAEWYLELEGVKELASYSLIKIKLDMFNKQFGGRKVADIKVEDLRNYQLMRQKQGAAPGTVDQDLGKVKAMINRAYDNDMISGRTHKVFRKIKKTLKKGADVRTRILSPEEFKELMVHAEGYSRNLIAIGYYTGMRKGEILSLIWEKVDLKNRIIKLEAGDTKDREARNIPICNELFKILQAMPNRIKASGKDNHVVQYKGSPVRDIRDGLRKACKEAKIIYGRFEPDGFIFHDLRHTFNTNMRKAGVPESVIMAITGHATREMFDRYNTIDGEDTRKAVDQYEAFLANVDYFVDQGPLNESAEDEKNAVNPYR